MKHRFIAVALLITTLLSGCGNTQTTEVISSAENQVTETPPQKTRRYLYLITGGKTNCIESKQQVQECTSG